MSETLTIARLGAQGDGIAETPGGAVYVPFALPGEAVEVAREKDRARVLSLLEPSAERVVPACRHFGTCGGCSIQHLASGPYHEWKRQKLVQALASRGIDAEVAQTSVRFTFETPVDGAGIAAAVERAVATVGGLSSR